MITTEKFIISDTATGLWGRKSYYTPVPNHLRLFDFRLEKAKQFETYAEAAETIKTLDTGFYQVEKYFVNTQTA